MRFLALWAFPLFICVQALLDEPAHNAKTTKPTFIVNLDSATVICQHSANNKDLHMHDLSILCNGKVDCFGDQTSMNDENFPYCDSTCELDCSKHGACLLNGTRPHCYCNTGFYGAKCENYNPNSGANSKTRSKSLGVSQSKANAFAQVKANGKHKYAGEDKNVASDDALEEASLAKEEQKKQLKINRQAQKQEGGYILLHNPSNSSASNDTFKVFDRKGDGNGGFEVVFRRCNSNEQEGCPENAECRNGNCECQRGFNWNPLSGRCEESRFDLNGQRFETSSVQAKRGGRFQTNVYGEWKNYTGGQLIISRGTFLPQPDEWGLELTGKMAGQHPQIIEEPDNRLKHKQTEQLSKSAHISTTNLTTNALDSRRTNSPSPTLHKNIKIEEIQLPSNGQNNFLKKISTSRKIHSLVYNRNNQTSLNSLKESQQHGKQIAKSSHASKINNGGFVALIKHPFTNNKTSTKRAEATTPSIIDEVEAVTKIEHKVFSTSEMPENLTTPEVLKETKSQTTIKPDLDEWVAEPEVKPKSFADKQDLTTTTETSTNSLDLQSTTTSSFDDWMITPEELPEDLTRQLPTTVHNEIERTFMPMSEDMPEQGLEIVVKSGEILFGTTTVSNEIVTSTPEQEIKVESEKFDVTKDKLEPDVLIKSTEKPNIEVDQPEHGLELVAKSGAVVFESTTNNNAPKDLSIEVSTVPTTMMEHGLEIIARLGQIIFETTTNSAPTTTEESSSSTQTTDKLSTLSEIKSSSQSVTRSPTTLTTSKVPEQSAKDIINPEERLTESTTQSSKSEFEAMSSSTLSSKMPTQDLASKQPSELPHQKLITMPTNKLVEVTAERPLKHESGVVTKSSIKNEVTSSSTASSKSPEQNFKTKSEDKFEVTTKSSITNEVDLSVNLMSKSPSDLFEAKTVKPLSTKMTEQARLKTKSASKHKAISSSTVSPKSPSDLFEVVTDQPLPTKLFESTSKHLLSSKMPEQEPTTKLVEVTTDQPLSTKMPEQEPTVKLVEVTTEQSLSTKSSSTLTSKMPEQEPTVKLVEIVTDQPLLTKLEDELTKVTAKLVTTSNDKVIEVVTEQPLSTKLFEQKPALKNEFEVTTKQPLSSKSPESKSNTMFEVTTKSPVTDKFEVKTKQPLSSKSPESKSNTTLFEVTTKQPLSSKSPESKSNTMFEVTTKSATKSKNELIKEVQQSSSTLLSRSPESKSNTTLFEVTTGQSLLTKSYQQEPTTKSASKHEVTSNSTLSNKLSEQMRLTTPEDNPTKESQASSSTVLPKLPEHNSNTTLFEVTTTPNNNLPDVTTPDDDSIDVTSAQQLKHEFDITTAQPLLAKSSQQEITTTLANKLIEVTSTQPLLTTAQQEITKLEGESIKSTTEQPLKDDLFDVTTPDNDSVEAMTEKSLPLKILQQNIVTVPNDKLIELTTPDNDSIKITTNPEHKSFEVTHNRISSTKLPTSKSNRPLLSTPQQNIAATPDNDLVKVTSNPDNKSIEVTTDQQLKHGLGVTTEKIPSKMLQQNIVTTPEHKSFELTTEQQLKHDFKDLPGSLSKKLSTSKSNPEHKSFEVTTEQPLTSKPPTSKTNPEHKSFEVTNNSLPSTKLPISKANPEHKSFKITNEQQLKHEVTTEQPLTSEFEVTTNPDSKLIDATTSPPLKHEFEVKTDQQLKHDFEDLPDSLWTKLPKQDSTTFYDKSFKITTNQQLKHEITTSPDRALSTKLPKQDSTISSESTQNFADSSTTVLPEQGLEIVAKSGEFLFETTSSTPSTNKPIEVATQTLPETSTSIKSEERLLQSTTTINDDLQTRAPLNKDLEINTKSGTRLSKATTLSSKSHFSHTTDDFKQQPEVSTTPSTNNTGIDDQKLFNVTKMPELKSTKMDERLESSLPSPTKSSVNVHPKDDKEVTTALPTQTLEPSSTVKPDSEVETSTSRLNKESTKLHQTTPIQFKTSDQTTTQSLEAESKSSSIQTTTQSSEAESKSSSIQTTLELSTKSKENGLEISMINKKVLPKNATTTQKKITNKEDVSKTSTKSNEVGLETGQAENRRGFVASTTSNPDTVNSQTSVFTLHTVPNSKSSEAIRNDISTQEVRTSTQPADTSTTLTKVSTQRSHLIADKVETKDPWMIEDHTQAITESVKSTQSIQLNETTVYSSTITPSIQIANSISTKNLTSHSSTPQSTQQEVKLKSTTSLNLGDLISSTQQPPLTTLESTIRKAPESTKPELAPSTMHLAKNDVSSHTIPEWPTKIIPIHTTRHKISEEWITTKSEEITNEPIILLKSPTTNQPKSTKMRQTVSINFVPKSTNVSVKQTTQLPTTIDDEELIRTDFVSTTMSSKEASAEEQEMESTKKLPDFSPTLTTQQSVQRTTQNPKVEDHVYTDFSGESTQRPQESTTTKQPKTGKVNSVPNDATTSIPTRILANIPTHAPEESEKRPGVETDGTSSDTTINEERSQGLLVAGKDQLEVKPSTKRPGLSKIDMDELLRSELEENKSQKTEAFNTKSTIHASSSTSFIQPEVLDFNKIGSSAPTHKEDDSSSEPSDKDNWVISVEDNSQPTPLSSETIEVGNKHREVSEFHKSQKVKITNKTGGKVEIISGDQSTKMPIDEDGLQINGQPPSTPRSSESPNVEVDELSGQKVEIDANGRKVKTVSGKSTKKSGGKVEIISGDQSTKMPIDEDGLQINGQPPTSSESSSSIEIDELSGHKIRIVSGKSTKSPQNVKTTPIDEDGLQINGQSPESPSVKVDQTSTERLEVDSNGHTIKTITKSTKDSSGRIEVSTKTQATVPTDISQKPADENGLQISGKNQPHQGFHPTSSELVSIELEEMNTKKLEVDANGRKIEASTKSTTNQVKTVSTPNQTTDSPEDVKKSGGPVDEQGLQISGNGQPQQNLQPTSPALPNIKTDETNSKTTTPEQTKIEVDSNGNKVEVFSESKIISSGSKSGKKIEVTTSRRIITPANGQPTQITQTSQTSQPDEQQGLQINGQSPTSTKLPNIEIDETNGQTINVDEKGQIVKNPNNLTPIDSSRNKNELANLQPGEHGLIITADSPNIEVDETNGQTVEINMHGSHKTSISGKSSTQSTKQVTATPLDNKSSKDSNQPTQKLPSNAFVTASPDSGPNRGPDEIPEAEDSETTQPPQRTVHLVKNVERFQNGTLKYWSTLVPVQKTSTEQTPQELGIEITGEDLQTTAKPPTSSSGLEISGDDINPVQNQTGELGLVIEGATQSPQTTVKTVEVTKHDLSTSETLPSRSTTKAGTIEVSTLSPSQPDKIGDLPTTVIPAETPSIIVDQTGPVEEIKPDKNEHGLVIENFANGWPEEFETTNQPLSTSSPDIEIATESSLSSQRPDDQLPKEASTIPVEEPTTNTQEPLILTADKTSPTPLINDKQTTQQSIELEKPLDESQAEFPQDGESTLSASKATSKIEQTTQSIERKESTIGSETSSLATKSIENLPEQTTVFNPPPEDQQTNKPIEEEDLTLQPNEFSTTKIVNELPETTLKPIEVVTDSSSQTTVHIEVSTLPIESSSPQNLSSQASESSTLPSKLVETTKEDLTESSTQKVEAITSKDKLTESTRSSFEPSSTSTILTEKEDLTERTRSSFEPSSTSTIEPKEDLTESSTQEVKPTTSKDTLIESSTQQIETITSKDNLIESSTQKIETITSKEAQSRSTVSPKEDLTESSTRVSEVQSQSTVSPKQDLIETSTSIPEVQSQSTVSTKEDLIESTQPNFEPSSTSTILIESSTSIPEVQSSTQKVEPTTSELELSSSTLEPTTSKLELSSSTLTSPTPIEPITEPKIELSSTSPTPTESTLKTSEVTQQNPETSTPINIDVLPEEPADELKNEPIEVLSTSKLPNTVNTDASTQPSVETTAQPIQTTDEPAKQELTPESTTKSVEQTQPVTEVPSTTQSPIEIASSTESIVQESTTQRTPQTSKSPVAKNGPHCVSSDECGIDAFCEKTRAECLCKRGFTGSPSSCKDIDECALKIDGCHPSSQCHNYVGGFTCQCPIGYRMTSSGVCVDVDECSERNLTLCSPDAHCRNIPGSYLCECKEGFNGDGLTCFSDTKRLCTPAEQLISETTRSHLCLVDSEGKVQASECKHGYSMQYGVCIDINECSNLLTNQCSDKGVCVNTEGSYYCQCKSGFKGDGINCEDIDECKRNPCHPQAMCINTNGNFSCSCPTGWKGDGIHSCINPLETICEKKSDICTSERNSDCLSMEVKRELASFCECAEGFRWNPKTKQCDDVNECIEQRSSCNTTTSFCVNKEGTYNCQCLDGFEGNDGVCVDIDECHRNTHTCHQNAYCVNLIGSYECACAEGFSGNGEICFFDEEDEGQEDNPTCNEDWTNYCRSLNKTCFVDEEEILQCGSCMTGYHLMDGKCMPLKAAGNCADPAKNDCDMNADCIDVHPGNHLCVCKNGFIGDGIHCDSVDFCRIPGICDQNAICQNLIGSFKCICHPGFVLVGRKCEPITEQSIKSCHQDKSVCHLNAECLHDGTCRCLSGYIGDGVSVCAPSQTQPPNDQPAKIPAQEQTYISGPISIKPPSIAPPTSVPQKVNPPSIKPPSIAPPSIAPTTLETTETSKSYKMVTMPQHKVTIKTTTPEAYQTPSPPTTTTPETYQILQTTKTVDTVGGYQKPDICSTLKCHQNAECINIEGAYKCSCHNGFYGDGHNCYRQEEVQPPLKVQCSADGMEVLLSEANKPFSGHVYVEGQKDNPYCSKTYSGQQASPTDQQPYKFFIPISHCNMKLENQNTLSATVIVQKHSTFITEQAYSYQVRCTYPLGVKLVDSKFDVKDLETATETAAVAQKLQPSCKIEVKNLENIVANSATVGQVMKLVLSVQPNETYGIRPRNCFAMNMETAERYRLTDEDGCAFDTDLFPQWTQLTKARTQSIFRTFKWPDCRMIRFECDCIPCLDKCPEIACSRKTYRAKRHLLHQKNSTTEADLNEQESNWMKNRVDGARRTAFSSVIYVREKQESEDAQREFEDWLVRDSKQDRRSTQTISSRLCFGDTWPLLIIVAGLLLLAVASILFLFHRLAQVQKDEKKRNLRHANSLGNLSAYIQF